MPIDQIFLTGAASVSELWPDVARACLTWLQGRALPARESVLLVPYAALLAPARAALAALGGWQPRVETPLTLAASLGPPTEPAPGLCSGDVTQDRLTARLLLQRQSWGAAWSLGDPAGFDRATAAVVDAAQALRVAALERAPAMRAGFWDEVRERLAPAAGPGAIEALLLSVAVEWAATTPSADTERCFQHRPAAWIVLRLGGPQPLAEALLGHGGTPSLQIMADPPADSPYAERAARVTLDRLCCDDFEDEAHAAAATLIEALNAGRVPVGLVALDRALVRRVRALLERAGVPLTDETGWLLSTTRAAGAIVALLRAALPGAGPDARLEWLKTWPPAPPRVLDALEARWRGRRPAGDTAAADALWDAAQAHLQPLAQAGPRALAAWLELLHDRLTADGSADRLAGDAAGVQVMAVLGWPGPPRWQTVAEQLRLDLRGFVSWVESTLEQAPFLPLPDAGAELVLTPLARAFGRPFAQLVVPGADAQRLGGADAPPGLIGGALAAAVGLEHAARRRERQRLALAQLLRSPRVSLLRRLRDGDEPVAESPEVEWLLLERERSGGSPVVPQHWRPSTLAVLLCPVPRPQPVPAQALPATLTASRLEALRACPYRFFARAVLRLDETEELQTALAKRDYGTWLHAVLHQFHSARTAAGDECVALQRAADEVTRDQGLDAGELLPFRASFEAFVPAYLEWLAEREARGWRWHSGETDQVLEPPELGGLRLRGRIDRLDAGPGSARQLLDYKTGSADALARKVRQPLEDTQLAFYAALLGGGAGLQAAYLALDDARAPREIVHPEVQRTARALVEGVGGEWQRLRLGAALPALGEGAVCETCEARGLCRRDHWGLP